MLENPRWEKFCQLYAVDGNASAAYRNAGYHPQTDGACWASAAQLLRNPKVQARIQELTQEARAQAERNAIADIAEIRRTLTDILRGQIDETKPADRIRAAELMTRIGGQQEPQTIQVQLTLEDKQARLQELLNANR